MYHRAAFVSAVITFLVLCSFLPDTPGQASPPQTAGASTQDRDNPKRRLAELPVEPEKAVPILLGLLDHDDFDVQMAATKRLRALGARATAVLVRQLKGPKCGHLAVLRGFVWLGASARDAVPELIGFLEDCRSSKRHELTIGTIEALGAIGPDAKDAVPLILQALNDDDKWVRVKAAEALGRIAANPKEVVPALCKAYSSIEGPWREVVVEALGKFRSRNVVAVALLIKALQDDDASMRETAAAALGELAPDCYKAIAPLREALRDQVPYVREAALASLRRYGEADVAAPALVALLQDEDDGIQTTAWLELMDMGSSAVESLVAALGDSDVAVRSSAAELIYYIGPQAAAAVPKLQRLLHDPAEEVRVQAAIGLAEIGEGSRPAIGALVMALSDPNPKVCRYAAFALGVIGERTKPVVDGLIGALQTNHASALAGVATSLAMLKVTDERALPRLVELLSMASDSEAKRIPYFVGIPNSVPEAALLAIRNYGTKAEAAKSEVLSLAVGQADEATRLAALRTMAEIGVTEAEAKRLGVSSTAEQQGVDAWVFHVLAKHPDIALEFLQQHPTVPSRLELDTSIWLRQQTGVEYTVLKKAVFERDDLPLKVMLQTRDPRYISVVKQRMEMVGSDRRAYMAACARALGDPPGHVVRISETQPGNFRPVYVGRVGGIQDGHGDGCVLVMITGRIRMPDDSPAVAPRFYRANDSMLLNENRKDPVDFDYDPKTGRFLFHTTVFAAFSTAKDREPGPYMTGTARILIEAKDAKPLMVQFFDEMPDVEITLSCQPQN